MGRGCHTEIDMYQKVYVVRWKDEVEDDARRLTSRLE